MVEKSTHMLEAMKISKLTPTLPIVGTGDGETYLDEFGSSVAGRPRVQEVDRCIRNDPASPQVKGRFDVTAVLDVVVLPAAIL